MTQLLIRIITFAAISTTVVVVVVHFLANDGALRVRLARLLSLVACRLGDHIVLPVVIVIVVVVVVVTMMIVAIFVLGGDRFDGCRRAFRFLCETGLVRRSRRRLFGASDCLLLLDVDLLLAEMMNSDVHVHTIGEEGDQRRAQQRGKQEREIATQLRLVLDLVVAFDRLRRLLSEQNLGRSDGRRRRCVLLTEN
jgi:hypothetical protein